MTGNEVRDTYISYFKKHKHKVISSSSLIPNNDPSLLFTNAGMVQFKRTFLGEESRNYPCATSFQKCLRAGGKHNDLKNVGYTSRHQTFFEMLGNFSFGNYFKLKAIEFAWDLITNIYKLASNTLLASVHYDDNESYDLWKNHIGMPENKIIRLGDKENFWTMGETGPCGPCSELYVDRGKNYGCKKDNCSVNCDCGRFIEIWNLVFMQFNKNKSGKIIPLPKPSIDTGLGLERLTSIIQNVNSNFEIDLILPIINYIEELSEKKFNTNKNNDIAMKVIADHSRAAAFLISDGIFPSNIGRGYVLRRIIRRAIIYGRNLGLITPFLYSTTKVVESTMGLVYPELQKSSDHISNLIKKEEILFSETIDKGLKILNYELDNLRAKKKRHIPGKTIFKLHDTYGLPIELINDISNDKNMTIDSAGFEKQMKEQREKSRSKKFFLEESKIYQKIHSKNITSKFIGYNSSITAGEILLIIKDGIETQTAKQGSFINLITDFTSFYGESGGQKGDKGIIESKTDNLKILVNETIKSPSGIIIHKGFVVSGKVNQNQKIQLKINIINRKNISRNHTTTHILHAILRQELGEHIKQAGSLVSANKLRFDFNHFKKISKTELENITIKINKKIQNNIPITTKKLTLKNALKSNALAIFEEKYTNIVRIVDIESFSSEFCGGTHVNHTGNIGTFIIISESGVSSGIRRIEALTGESAINHIQKTNRIINDILFKFNITINDIVDKIDSIYTSTKKTKNKIEELNTENAILKNKIKNMYNSETKNKNYSTSDIINNITVITEKTEPNTVNILRKMVDQFKANIKSGIIILGCEKNKKALIVIGITKDLTKKFNANNIIKGITKLIDGNGGGRADLAEAGGTKPEFIDKAFEKAKIIINNTKQNINNS